MSSYRSRKWVRKADAYTAMLPAAERLQLSKQTHGPWTERDLSKALKVSSGEAKQALAASEEWMSSQLAPHSGRSD
jgi:hypothetical protein